LARTDLAASPQQRSVSQIRPHPAVSDEIKNGCHSIPHPTYSPDLAPCDLFLFPKIRLKLKGHQFVTIEEIQTESQKRTSRKRFKNGGDGGTGVYMQEGNTSRVMVVDRPYGEFYDFYSISPEYFGYTFLFYLTKVCAYFITVLW
jgi:hypothetical protein